MHTKIINSWIQEARWSPSGGNCQPWQVKVIHKLNILEVVIMIRQDYQIQPSFADQWGVGAVIALGSFAQGLIELSSTIGLSLTKVNVEYPQLEPINYFSTKVHLEFEGNIQALEPLSFPTEIKRRMTYRWPMETMELPKTFINSLFECSDNQGVEFIDLTSQKAKVISIYRELAFIRMHNRDLFKELMSEIFDPEQEPMRTDGLPYKTLGLGPVTLLFLNFVKKMGLHFGSRFINQKNVTDSIDNSLNHCSALFYLNTINDSPEDWFHVGRSFHAIALLTIKNDFVIQPIAYNLLAYNHIHNLEQTLLSKSEQSDIHQAINSAKHELNIDFNRPGLLFRIGKAIHPSLPSPRRMVEVEYQSLANQEK
jgi:hypothetical protein